MYRLWPLLLLALCACAIVQAPPSAPPGKALVYAYRRAIPIGPATVHVFDGGKDVGALSGGTYLDFIADPGPRVFRAVVAGSSSMPYGTTLDAGRTYYFLVYLLGDQLRGIPALTPMDAASASAQVKDLKPAGLDAPD